MRKKKIMWGVLIILAAVWLICDKLGIFEVGTNAFGIIASIVMVGFTIDGLLSLNFFKILMPLAIIGCIYDDPLGITAITPWTLLLAALLLSIGLQMVFGRSCKNFRYNRKINSAKNHDFQVEIDEADGEDVEFGNKFGASIKYVNSVNMKRAILHSSFGEIKVYFDNANISGDKAEIQLDVSFGAAELYIPKTWNVKNQAQASFGAIEEKNSRQGADGPTVYLTGDVSFGGVEIYYV